MYKIKYFIRRHETLMCMLSCIYNIPFFIDNFFSAGFFSINGAFVKHTKCAVKGKNNKIVIAKGSRLYNCKFTILGDSNSICIGPDCELKNLDIWCAGGATVILKGKVHVTGATHCAATEGKSIQIGEDCLFSNNIVIRNGDSHSVLSLDGKRLNPAQNVVIGKHVWIGQNVTILKGTVIGDNSIVGTGAIITGRAFPANVVIAGTPAKIVKENVNWDSKV